jgi:hypothetical protein
VLCQLGLMFMQDRQAALAEMRRVTVPGGRVILNTPGSIQPPFAFMEQALVDHIGAHLGGFVRAVFSMPNPAVASLLRDAGLVDVTAAMSTATLKLGAPAEFLWRYINLSPMAPFVAQAPATRSKRWSAKRSTRGSRSSSTTRSPSTSQWWSRPGTNEAPAGGTTPPSRSGRSAPRRHRRLGSPS